MSRTPTKRELVLHLLRAAGGRGITTGELLGAGVGSRYSARVHELRERGYVISAERLGPGEWRYKLIEAPAGAPIAAPSEPEPARLFSGGESPPVSAIDGDVEGGLW